MKFGQLIEYDKRNIFLQKSCRNHAENETGRLVPDLFLFFKKALHKVQTSGLELGFTLFREPQIKDTIKTNFRKLQTIDPEIYSILTFQKGVWEQFLHHILFIIFQQKFFSCYILLTDQISLSDCFYFLRYQAICVVQFLVNQVVTL